MTLNNISWTFTSKVFTSAYEFDKEVAQFQIDGYKTNRWKPREIVFDFSELQVKYEAWITKSSDLLENEVLIDAEEAFDVNNSENGMFQVEILAKLKADNGKNFTALEFLMKVHNQQANKELGDHIFFEGTDENPEIIDDIPTCYIACGS